MNFFLCFATTLKLKPFHHKGPFQSSIIYFIIFIDGHILHPWLFTQYDLHQHPHCQVMEDWANTIIEAFNTTTKISFYSKRVFRIIEVIIAWVPKGIQKLNKIWNSKLSGGAIQGVIFQETWKLTNQTWKTNKQEETWGLIN